MSRRCEKCKTAVDFGDVCFNINESEYRFRCVKCNELNCGKMDYTFIDEEEEIIFEDNTTQQILHRDPCPELGCKGGLQFETEVTWRRFEKDYYSVIRRCTSGGCQYTRREKRDL